MDKKPHKTQIDLEMDEYIKQNSGIIYKKVSQEVGSTAFELPKDKSRGINGNFTNVIFNLFEHLVKAGMYRFNGLNTVVDKEKNINGSKDWMQKLV